MSNMMTVATMNAIAKDWRGDDNAQVDLEIINLIIGERVGFADGIVKFELTKNPHYNVRAWFRKNKDWNNAEYENGCVVDFYVTDYEAEPHDYSKRECFKSKSVLDITDVTITKFVIDEGCGFGETEATITLSDGTTVEFDSKKYTDWNLLSYMTRNDFNDEETCFDGMDEEELKQYIKRGTDPYDLILNKKGEKFLKDYTKWLSEETAANIECTMTDDWCVSLMRDDITGEIFDLEFIKK